MAIPITLNGTQALSARVTFPWRGPWYAEVEIAPEIATAAQLQSMVPAPAVLTLGTNVLTGTIDPTGSGTFTSKASFRVIGGRGGWGKHIPAQDFAIPGGGVLSTMVYAATGALVGEIVTDTIPEVFGDHYSRTAGPASSVFGDKDWFVEPTTGIAIVSAWPPLPLDPTATLVEYEPYEGRASVISDTLILPGSVIIDTDGRLNGQVLKVREVEQVFSPEGITSTLWCNDEKTSRLADMFANVVRAFGNTKYLKTYKYALIVQALGKVTLQSKNPEAPDLGPVDAWTGLSGISNMLTPGTEIIVGFADGDPTAPYLVSFSPLAIPLTIDMVAATSISLTAPAIGILGATTFGPPGTSFPLAFGPWATALQAALVAFSTGLTAGTLVANAGALATALGALPPAATLLMKGN